jgi:tetratricopeptide (TPR) repeat protein
MTTESTPASSGGGAPPAVASGSQVSPAERARLQKCFQTGTQNAATNVDYAIEMFGICVAGDLGNAIYLQSLMAMLRKKHGIRKGVGLGSLWSAGARAGLKKLATNAQWRELLKQGLQTLKSSPNDTGTLLAMADACGQLQFYETQRVYLKCALDAAPTDPEVNRHCAKFLADHGEFDQAIACWVRVSNLKGMGEESQREIARLQVEKTIVAGHGMTGRPGTTARPAAAAATASGGTEPPPAPGNRAAELEETIRQNPAVIEPYLELADILERDRTAEEAERLLHRALAASGNDLKVREHLEDRQLRWARHRVHIAEKRVEADDNETTRATLEQLKATQLKQEIDVYSARSERYPENLTWRYELAMRLKAAGSHAEAIRHFQEVQQDVRRRGAVSLELGECFQKIKQYPLAMRNYQTAVDTLTDRELDLRKRALYRAGVLAAGMADVDAAQKYLSILAGLDFGYRDVAQRLDKLAALGDKGKEES